MINRNLITVKNSPVGTINYMVTHFLSFFCSTSMLTEYRIEISTVCIFQTKGKKSCPEGFPAPYVRIPWFMNLFFFLTAWQALGKGLWVQPSQDVGPWEKLLAVCFVVTGSKLTWMMKSWMEKYLMDNFPTSYSHRISVWIYSSQVQGQLPEWTCEPNSNRRHFWRHCRGRVMAPNHRPTTRCSSSLLAAPLERLHSRRLPTSY